MKNKITTLLSLAFLLSPFVVAAQNSGIRIQVTQPVEAPSPSPSPTTGANPTTNTNAAMIDQQQRQIQQLQQQQQLQMQQQQNTQMPMGSVDQRQAYPQPNQPMASPLFAPVPGTSQPVYNCGPNNPNCTGQNQTYPTSPNSPTGF